MGVFEAVKQNVDIIKVCDILGIKLNCSYKAYCPFHKEKTPSFSISPQKQIWKCFGCNDGGDVISLVCKILNCNPLDSCKYLNEVFGLGLNFKGPIPNIDINRYKQKQEAMERFRKWENESFQILCDYLHSLEGVKKYQEQDKIEYYLDIFIYGTKEDILWFKKMNQKVVDNAKRELGR